MWKWTRKDENKPVPHSGTSGRPSAAPPAVSLPSQEPVQKIRTPQSADGFHPDVTHIGKSIVIIQAVRETSSRGVRVAELSPDSKSDLLHRYRVLTVPIVLQLDESGTEIGRFEGEDAATLKAIKARLATLSGTGP